MLVILLSGWSGSGKDAVASILTERAGFKRFAFADPLKEIVAEELKIPLHWCHDPVRKASPVREGGSLLREILIERGQAIRAERNDPGFFASCIAKKIRNMPHRHFFVISDWRLHVEFATLATLLQDATFVKLRVEREGHVSPVPDSLTEHQLDRAHFDGLIFNPGTTLAALEREVLQKLSHWVPQFQGIHGR